MSPTLTRLAIVVAIAGVAVLGFRVWKAWSLRRSTRLMQDSGRTGGLTLLYFSGPNCAQCGAQEAVLSEVARANPDVVFESYDASVDAELASRVGVMSVPTTVVLDERGRVVARNGRFVNGGVLHTQLEAARSSPGRASSTPLLRQADRP